MCGIAGITNKELVSQKLIEKMTRTLSHRGPDDDGFFVDDSVALGMRRLAIIDLVKGDQPISSTDGRYLIFFNGEIYNYKEIKKELAGYDFKTDSDTEVILAGYLKWGGEVLTRLRGMFAFAIYDTQEKKVFIARDPFGIKPLYYWKRGEKIMAFSSEIKSFIELPEFETEVNDAAVYNYLSYQYNPLKETFFKNVFKLPPAHYLTIDLKTGEWEEKRYWQFKFTQNNSLLEEETKKEILKTMEDSVAHHMIADVPVGSFLSGGIDSSIIATLMQKIRGEKKIKTFTVGFESLSEGVEARETSEPLGTDHTEITVGRDEYFEALKKAIWHFDEPVADPSAIGLYFLAREARKSVTVVLSGEGSDELFGGYNIYLEPFARRYLAWAPHMVLKFLASLPLRGSNYAERALSKLEDWYIGNASIFKPSEIKNLWLGQSMSRAVLDTLYQEASSLSDSAKMQYIDINTWLVGDILAKADKMTMAHSLELRVPFLDPAVAGLAEILPDRFKWHSGTTKYLLREAFKSVLPESTRKRKKLGFPTPIHNWIETEDVKNTIFQNKYIKSHFNLNVVEKLFENSRENSRKIYLLLMLALWYNVFITNNRE
ncbi:MAG: asparagine synthase (glutamine-hydrolyzing) [Candidatus Zambryskibacteria bacterium]|nr:asparagine synthase (glutamine-hydrolyzing) [Candidatus Zambryskibacteria bacterium]